jgi:hypothetical protein
MNEVEKRKLEKVILTMKRWYSQFSIIPNDLEDIITILDDIQDGVYSNKEIENEKN